MCFAVMKFGAKLTDEEVSDMVRVIRDAGGGLYLVFGLFQTGRRIMREERFFVLEMVS